jgi:septum formation protein
MATTIPEIILASSSPQRSHILEELEIPFKTVWRDVDEITGETPEETVEYNAGLKAETVAGIVADDKFVLAADTVLGFNGRILGKPANEIEAKSFLTNYRGKTIKAYTGLAVVHRATGSSLVTHESAEIVFKTYSQGIVNWYVATGEPLTRAGAFGISKRGEILVKAIHGSYSCIAGLPKFSTIILLSTAFEKAGISLPDFFPSSGTDGKLALYTPSVHI